jgi:hypothetical protein
MFVHSLMRGGHATHFGRECLGRTGDLSAYLPL